MRKQLVWSPNAGILEGGYLAATVTAGIVKEIPPMFVLEPG